MRAGSVLLGCFVTVTSLSSPVLSFPTVENFVKLAQRGSPPNGGVKLASRAPQGADEKRLLFDSMSKPIDVTGDHAFAAPDFDNGDQRGPCPGLNALANHGYLSRDGVIGFTEVIEATNTVYGLGPDIAVFLGVMGLVDVGNPLSLNPGFSIGAQTPKSSNILDNLGGLLGTPSGLDHSHNFIEADASITRDDLYTSGNAWTMNMTLFEQYINSNDGDVLDINDDLGKRAAERLEECIANNGQCYFGPFTGMVARNAGILLGGRLLSNHSAEYPNGHMTKDVFKSFWGVYEEDGKLTYKEGWEQIPSNWYRRPADYTLIDLNMDLITYIMKYPILASIGGNLGEPNTFTGVNLEDITGGVLNAAKLLEGNNLICFALEIVKTFSVNSLSSLFETLETPLKLVTEAVADPLLNLGCPAFEDMTYGGTDLFSGLLEKFPGAKKSGFAF